MYRRQRKFLKEKFLIFVQGTADVVFADQRGQTDGSLFTRTGSGMHLQVRPGINYYLSKTTALEAGFGRVEALYMQWSPASNSGFVGNISQFDFNTNFNLSSVFLGMKVQF
jgi:hypothetical protein